MNQTLRIVDHDRQVSPQITMQIVVHDREVEARIWEPGDARYCRLCPTCCVDHKTGLCLVAFAPSRRS